MIVYVRCNDCGETIDNAWAETCPKCGSANLQEIHEPEPGDDEYSAEDMRDDPEPPDDDDPHGITARNKWADEEYGLDDGTG